MEIEDLLYEIEKQISGYFRMDYVTFLYLEDRIRKLINEYKNAQHHSFAADEAKRLEESGEWVVKQIQDIENSMHHRKNKLKVREYPKYTYTH